MMIQEDGRTHDGQCGSGQTGSRAIRTLVRKAWQAPVVASFGHDPLLLMVANAEIPNSISEYAYAGP